MEKNGTGGGKLVIAQNIIQQYKELIDFVYTLTKDKEYTEGFAGYNNSRLSAIVTELTARKVLEKKSHYRTGGNGRYCGFRWIASSEPTAHFVNSVAHAIESKKKEYQDRYLNKKRAMKESIAAEQEADERRITLSDFSSADLWAELKRRGAEIKDGRLMIVSYTPLD